MTMPGGNWVTVDSHQDDPEYPGVRATHPLRARLHLRWLRTRRRSRYETRDTGQEGSPVHDTSTERHVGHRDGTASDEERQATIRGADLPTKD